jgi:hypothetical protein
MMLAGKNPFESESFHSVIAAIMQREPARLPEVPEPIWAVIEKALAKDAKERYADATELGIALRRASGRATSTDSGVYASAEQVASVRNIVPPLGGDSHVSVPPVGNAELGDGAGSTPPQKATPAARQRAIRIVGAIVAASIALTIVALVRSPGGSTSSGTPSSTSEVPNATATAAATATVTATAATAATAQPSATATTAATTTANTAVSVALPAGARVADAGAAAMKAGTGNGTKKKEPASETTPYDPVTGALKEPAAVRDPGF